MNLLLAAPVLAAALILTGCGNRYPTNVETNFLNACELNGGTVSRCGCALDSVEQSISIEQYQVDEASYLSTRVMPTEVMNALSGC